MLLCDQYEEFWNYYPKKLYFGEVEALYNKNKITHEGGVEAWAWFFNTLNSHWIRE